MSTLEVRSTPAVGSLLHDMAMPLDESSQHLLAQWATKTSMVWDAMVHRDRTLCYTANERETLRKSPDIPDLTAIWVGRGNLVTTAKCEGHLV
jgi:hypothetical protein